MINLEKASRRQLALSFDVSFSVPAEGSLACLDEWLTSVLEIAAVPRPAALAAEAWLWRALLLARDWFQAGRVPVLDLPEIASLAADRDAPDKWRAKVRLALVEHLPHSLYAEVLSKALRLCAWAAARRPEPRARAAVFAAMQRFAAERLENAAGAGRSTLPVLVAAHRAGIPFMHLGGGVFQLGWGSQARRIDRAVTAGDSAIGAKLCQNKLITAAMLRAGGLPAPDHHCAATPDEALAAARLLGWPVVLKPIAKDGGVGVTIDVADEAMLRRAFTTAAAAAGVPVIVERQAAGVSHRLFVAHGALLFAVRRQPMGIRGDGQRSVAALVAAKAAAEQRRPPWKRRPVRPLAPEALQAMAKAGFAADSVPAAGAYVPLRHLESPTTGGLFEDVGGIIHLDNVAAALQAAELMGLRVAGIDFITTDIGQPWHQTGAIINEVNFAPMLGAHDISRRAIPAFLDRLMAGNGRIPVHVFIGGAPAWRAAAQLWRKLTAGGAAAYLTSARKTLEPSGAAWPMPFDNIGQRARALVLSAQVGAIILAARPEELVRAVLPFDRVDTLIRVGEAPVSAAVPMKPPGFPTPDFNRSALTTPSDDQSRTKAAPASWALS